MFENSSFGGKIAFWWENNICICPVIQWASRPTLFICIACTMLFLDAWMSIVIQPTLLPFTTYNRLKTGKSGKNISETFVL